jgi:hypothetical protein
MGLPIKPAEVLLSYAGPDKATLTLNDMGECRLKINGQEREFWQFRRTALEDLFFPH